MWTHQFMSPSKIDNYLKYISGYKYNFGGDALEEYSTEDFIDNLLKIEVSKNAYKMEAGTAFHNVIELAGYKQLPNQIKSGNWTVIIPVELNIDLEFPVCREIWVRGNICGHSIIGKMDGIDAIKGHDLKTTSKIDLDSYAESMQWKVYCLLSGIKQFVYDIFQVDIVENSKTITIKAYEKLELYTYPGMQTVVEQVINDYHCLLLVLEPQIIARVNEYNSHLTSVIDQLSESPLRNLVDQLKTKYLTVKGLTDV